MAQSKSLGEEGLKQLGEGNYTAAATFMHSSQVQAQAYWSAQVTHYLAGLSSHIVDGVSQVWDKMKPKPRSPAVEPVILEPKKVNRHSFFSSRDAAMGDEQTADNLSVNEVGRTCEFK
ncbi:hypothetical protein [Legionella rowbothamii]|uniref:hypothetical protein n=1 Tax=Legionella rowbothamii TaxID=96229 RepID=UPI0010555517|nr:hypothetical protein [Legionella rowbothamii]